jgi:Ca2+-binding RTX toxin-like protein
MSSSVRSDSIWAIDLGTYILGAPMVFRIAHVGDEVLDLNNSADDFGEGDDVLVIRDSYGVAGVVATYDGDDIVVLNDLGAGFGGPVHAGTGSDRVFGGAGVDVLSDGDGDDLVYGAGGNDEIFADRGADVYDGGSGSDIVHFSVIDSNGPDEAVAISAAVTCDLAVTGAQDLGVFGTDVLHAIENIFGGGGDDTFFGSDVGNGIEGRGGSDLINGRAGNDTLFAFDGADTMIGGAGADRIVLDEPGGAARDLVRFQSIQDSGTTGATRDIVADFDVGTDPSDDRIDLSAIDARTDVGGNQAFVFVSAFTSASGEVRVAAANGGVDTIVLVDTDTDSAAEMSIRLANATGVSADDFIL